MKAKKIFRLAYSSCPNDTFIFKAIARKLIDLGGYGFDIVLEDVETLNRKAVKGMYDITKLSFATFGSLMDQYALLRSGSALGVGCGPMIISLPGRALNDQKIQTIAVPGLGTTAYHLFTFFMAEKFPGQPIEILPMPFETVMPAVLEEKADFGVIIHEGRFVYESLGLLLNADLGQWWEDVAFLPIPLGCIAIRRDIDPAIACDIQTLIRRSIDHAFSHPDLAYDYIQTHAQEMEETVIRQHIGLYVNEFSKDLGRDGQTAIKTFFKKARESGLIRPSDMPLFAC
jgi:1,4-dihydroxy-6-naphthoate synthase